MRALFITTLVMGSMMLTYPVYSADVKAGTGLGVNVGGIGANVNTNADLGVGTNSVRTNTRGDTSVMGSVRESERGARADLDEDIHGNVHIDGSTNAVKRAREIRSNADVSASTNLDADAAGGVMANSNGGVGASTGSSINSATKGSVSTRD